MSPRKWIVKFTSLPKKVQPYVVEMAVVALKNLGISGGGAIADAIIGADKVREDNQLDRIDDVLGVVLSQGRSIMRLLEHQAVSPKRVSAELQLMAREQKLVQLSLEEMGNALREIPGMVPFLRDGLQDLRRVVSGVERVGHKVDNLSDRFQSIERYQAGLVPMLEERMRKILREEIHGAIKSGTSDEKQVVEGLLARMRDSSDEDAASFEVKINVISGPAAGRDFAFHEPGRFFFGRAKDAQCSITGDPCVSKNHFVVDVCPPLASLHDLNSKNGTFVNGTCYGSRRASAQESGADQPSSVLLQDGDLIVVGDTRLSVAIYQQAEVASEETKLHSGSEAKPSAVKSGLLLLPEFEIIRLLKGSAGPAKAFLAHDRQTGRKVILKVILPELALDRKARQRFERESHLARNLKHKNVVGFLDGGYSRGTIYLVLEFVDGLSLEALWRRRGKRLSWELATLLVLQILDGLAFLHDRGVIHRDLKPKNILLQKRLRKPVRPKITDLGMARLYRSAGLTDMTSPGALGGSPFFWPREQITEFRDLTPSADIYSLGTIFFRLLTGRFARPSLNDLSEDASFHSICEGIMRGGPEPISGIEGLPPVVAEVIDRSLSEDPRDRYPDAGAMRAALADGLDGQIRRNSSGSAR